jgi:transposase-like protein
LGHEDPGSEDVMARRKTRSRKAKSKTADRGRFSAKKKTDAVLRLLRGEELDVLSRELGVTAATLSTWRDQFLAGGEANLKTRKTTPEDDEIQKLKVMIGDLTMRNELLRQRADALEEERPFPWRRSSD